MLLKNYNKIVLFVRKYNIDVFVFYSLVVFVFFLNVKNHIIGSADSYNQFLPLRVFYSEVLKSGDFPLWYPYQALGLPFLGIVQAGGLYPLNLILYKFFDPFWAYNFSIYLHFVLSQFFGFLYSNYLYNKIGLSRIFAVFSGFIFGLSGFSISHVDFVPLQNSLPYLPLGLLFLNIIIDNWKNVRLIDNLRYNFVWLMGLSLSMGYQFLAGYPQAFLYTFIFYFLFVLFSNYRLVWVIFFAFLLSFPIIFISVYEVIILSSLSIRNYINFETYNQGSLPLYALINQVIPFIFGGSVSNPNYYGPSTGTISFEFLAYISFWALPLAIFAYLKIFSSNEKIFSLYKIFKVLGLVGIVSFVLALGKYNLVLHYLLFDVPFYSKVRVVARHLMEISFIQSVFIPLALYYILSSKKDLYRFFKVSFYTYVSVILISVWFFINPEVGKNLSKISIISVDLYFPLLLAIVFLVVLFLHYGFRFFSLRETIFFIFFVFFLNSWFVFNNISPSYLSGWWGRRENVESYIDYIGRLDSDYRICYFTGFPILFNAVSNRAMLNYYEPVIPFDFVKFFNIWMNGSFLSPNDYFFILNNSILSAFSVKYLFINDEFKNKYRNYISLDSLVSVPVKNLDFEKRQYKFNDFSQIARNSNNLTFDMINNSIILRNNSRINLKFENSVFNKFILVFFKSKVSRMNWFYRYKRLILGLNDGIGIELKNNDRVLGYYFVNGYYIANDKWEGFVIPFFIDFDRMSDFVDLTVSIYPVYSLERFYEIKDLEIISFPLKVVNLFDNQIKKAYIYSNSFMGYDLYINYQSLPLVYSPSKVHVYSELYEVKYGLSNLSVNPIESAFILYDSENHNFNYQIKKSGISKVKVRILEKKCNYVKIGYIVDGEGLVVFNDMYYRGWVVRVDGKKQKILKVNGFVKGVWVKGEGEREGKIEFIYQPFDKLLLMFNIVLIYGYFLVFILFLLLRNVVYSSFQIKS